MSATPVICIVMATLLEADPMIESLSMQRTEKKPFLLYQKDDIVLVISGIGKANAAMATAYCCLKFEPQWVCNLGAAGATGSTHVLGATYLIEKVIEYDRPSLRSGIPQVHKPNVLSGFEMATIATQDRPIVDEESRKEIALVADLVDMEAASVIQSCSTFDVDCILLKFVSDTPDHSKHRDVVENIKQYRTQFCKFFLSSVMPILMMDPQK